MAWRKGLGWAGGPQFKVVCKSGGFFGWPPGVEFSVVHRYGHVMFKTRDLDTAMKVRETLDTMDWTTFLKETFK